MPKGRTTKAPKKQPAEKEVKRCSISALAELLGCSVRNVNILVKDRIIPAPDKDHKYDWLACNHAYINHFKEKSLLSKSKIDEEIKQIEKERKQFKLEQEKGLWIPRDDVVGELVRRVHVLKSDLLSLERRMPAGSKEKNVVKKFVRTLLKNYSQKSGVFRDAGK